MPPYQTEHEKSKAGDEAVTPSYRVAIIGSGITGIGAAVELHRAGIDFVMFEKEKWAGGHACTVDAKVKSTATGEEKSVPVDAGFIVFNESTYPNLCRLFEEHDVPSFPSDMSFSVSVEKEKGKDRVEWASTGLRGLFPTFSSLFRADIYRMLADMQRFHKIGPKVLEDPITDEDVGPTLREYLTDMKFSQAFIDLYMIPMIAAVWSSSVDQAMDYPARALFRFFHNHCFYQIADRPDWRTVKGGSKEYVKKVCRPFSDNIKTGCGVKSVKRGKETGVEIELEDGRKETFHDVIFATHADITLGMLGEDATVDEQALLSSFKYAPNEEYMHTDARLMPESRAAWASWNVLKVASNHDESAPVCVTYWMNRLQDLGKDTPDIFVTLNPPAGWTPHPDTVLHRFSFAHPQFDLPAISAQVKLGQIQGKRHAYYAGAWCQYGFHEDGLKAGIAAAHSLLSSLSSSPLPPQLGQKAKAAMALPFPAEWSLAAVPSTVTAVWRGLRPVPASSAIAPQELAKDTIAGAMGSFAFTLVSSFLSSYVKEGCLEVRLPKGKVVAFGQTPYVNGVVPVRLQVHTFAFFKRIAFFHDIGLAEAYMAGDFDVDHPQVLVDLFSLLVRNSASPSVSSQREREGGERGGVKKWVTSLMYAVMCGVGSKMNSVSHHFFHSNSVKNARKNIAAHYDLPPSFFASFLGNTTVYSSALFASPASSLDEAQYAKMDAIIAKARIDKSDTVLEIGGGWGDFAIYCARKTGCKVTAITISQQQYDNAVERIKKEGMEEQVEFKICDYRHVQGVYSRIVSIEMIEAVGHDYLPSFFDTIDRCLAPQGLAVIQAITMPEDRYDAYRKSSDFINKHIFPGGCCPSVRALTIAAKNLTLCEVSEHAPHYARTLREWRSSFLDSEQKIKALGFDDVFIRKWVYYLTYCEAGFKERSIGLHHLVFSRSLNVKALKRAGYDYE